MEFAITKATATRVPRQRLQSLARAIGRGEKLRPGDRASLIFGSDNLLRQLNARWRDNDRPTDVLSFPFDDDGFLGEIYISVETAARQAVTYEATLSQEYLRLACHGCLHLLGYDHVVDSDAQRMRVAEQRYLRPFIAERDVTW